jgi:capsid protein
MQQTPEFIRTMFRMIGQPFGMPLEVVAMDMSTCNFASARIGLLPFYRKCRIKAGRFGSRWSRTIRWWLSRERLRSPDDPKRWVSAWPANYWSHDLLINAWDYTDPVSEIQADMLACDAGFKAPQDVIEGRGNSAADTIRKRMEWIKETQGLPQTHSTMTRDPAPEPVEPDKTNQTEDDDDEPDPDTSAGD